MKRTLGWTLALALLLTLCAPMGLAASDGAEAKTLTVMASRSAEVVDYDTNEYIKWLEETTGIDVTWQQVPSATLKDKIPVVLMSDDLPDAFLGCALTSAQQAMYGGQEGVLIPLNELIDQYGSETKRLFEEQPGVRELITLTDGNIYALPTYSDIIHCNYAQKVQINTTFLEALGMEMPKTTEDFYQFLKAVKEQDPNGNGQADEIPLMGNIEGWHHDIFPFLTEPFVFDDGMYGKKVDVDENGKVFSILTTEDYREALRYIHKLYAEGLLYEPSLTMKADQYQPIGENPDAMILGAAAAAGNGSFTQVGGERYQHYRALPPLTGPDGLCQTPWFRYVNVRMGAYAITKACADPALAMQLADAMYSYDASMRLRMGVKDVDWRDATAGETTFDNRPAVWARITPYTGAAQNQHLGNDGMFYETRGMFLDDSAFDHSQSIMTADASQFLLAQETVEKYVPCGKEVFPPVTIPLEDADEFYSLEVELTNYYKEARAAFTTGDMDLEGDWQGYVDGLNAIGLARYVELLQKAYDQSAVKIGA